MICLDVDYRSAGACAAGVLFRDWQDETHAREVSVWIPQVADYTPGEFYKRELPCLLQVLQQAACPLAAAIIDGYVWLDDSSRPGLGWHLYQAMGETTPVIGVGKTAFAGSNFAAAICRGKSKRPLYVTAVGIDLETAAAQVKAMHGEDRVPTLLRRVDRLSRTAQP